MQQRINVPLDPNSIIYLYCDETWLLASSEYEPLSLSFLENLLGINHTYCKMSTFCIYLAYSRYIDNFTKYIH